MKLWDKMALPMRRVWNGVALRLGIRKSGLLRLRRDVRSCEYEDVRVMWEMLKRNEPELARSPSRSKKRLCLNFFGWARSSCTPHLCRSCPYPCP
ncbi:hypothetical protein CICLE_v10002925mg [Citrus x clementina]|uniref:Uncharacterized protein n=1 Tax=Citrus clementina TaxID=85681 RepID=V4V4L1_CITCL|nr:uncharacterized protein LOC18042792 [Citrus x clementina]XP_052298323.1 uncharacterized protein LOC112497688 [Citrus sinensis]ESR46858.1 hypothetical protein CICLE_v10002925mg [Citrus x clementina]ESR46859.1 hypothetical protein CICLE_v10002925mg [Citrus x clementina]